MRRLLTSLLWWLLGLEHSVAIAERELEWTPRRRAGRARP
jgi:hypothetical protein